ncbi:MULTISPECIES: PrpF domain-containing protein [Bacillus amyloliquefaciens group]|uniref:PrpF domain-containing protein n=1 Tax=Bacillus amyloliquefaciens group TaxID=1938374 RepID=UPI000C75BC00|nr:PrpF domain-containing protein [Bacillus velezensis]AUJ61250.1 hypothetical protein B6257_11945 [Bacillus velezensis]
MVLLKISNKIIKGIVKSGESLICVLMVDKLLIKEKLVQNSYEYCNQIIEHLGGKVNKVAIIYPSLKKDLDCECLFLQYIPQLNSFDISGNCGNAIVAAAVYYMNKKQTRNIEALIVENINTNKRIKVMLQNFAEDFFEVEVTFFDPEGSITSTSLPTGNIIDKIHVNNKEYLASIVDTGNPYIFIERSQLDLSISEFKDPNLKIYREFELIRHKAKCLIGLNENSVFPKFSIVNKVAMNNSIEARMISVPTWHKAFALTGLACLIKAVLISGSVVNQNISIDDASKEITVYFINKKKMKVKYQCINQNISTICISQTVKVLKGGF